MPKCVKLWAKKMKMVTGQDVLMVQVLLYLAIVLVKKIHGRLISEKSMSIWIIIVTTAKCKIQFAFPLTIHSASIAQDMSVGSLDLSSFYMILSCSCLLRCASVYRSHIWRQRAHAKWLTCGISSTHFDAYSYLQLYLWCVFTIYEPCVHIWRYDYLHEHLSHLKRHVLHIWRHNSTCWHPSYGSLMVHLSYNEGMWHSKPLYKDNYTLFNEPSII